MEIQEKFQLITTTLILCMYDWRAATQDVIHILPNNHAADTNNNCLNDLDCRTLNEWIENDTSPFANDTKVVLLPGLHLVNSTKDRLITKNVPPDWLTMTIAFAGEQGLSTIECLHHFSFDFINLKHINISNISFTFCELAILYTVDNNSSVQQNNKERLPDLIEDLARLLVTIEVKAGNISLPSSVHFLDVNFVDTSLKIHCDVQEVQIQLLVMQRVTFERVTRLLTAALGVRFVKEIRFTDITFQNNTSPLIEIVNFTHVVFEDHCSFHGSRGEWGTFISNGLSFNLLPHSKLYCSNNDVMQHMFHINLEIRIPFVNDVPAIIIWSSVIVMQNNTVRNGGILQIYCKAEMHIEFTDIIFSNNRSLESTLPLFHATMLIVGTPVYVKESTFKFLYNSARLSGGMTLVNCTLFMIGKVTFLFDFNQGQDGGAMAFYENSKIYNIMESNSNVLIRFHHNRALKRGGGTFVEDADYIDIITRYTFGSDTYIIHLPPNRNSLTIIEFSNNTAEFAGNQIYGGLIDLMFYGGTQALKLPEHDLNAIASNPIRICMCLHSIPFCNITEHRVELFPGQIFEIEAVAVGQRMGIVPSIVFAQFNDEEGRLRQGQDVRNVGRECTVLHFNIHSSKAFKKLDLKVQQIGVPVINFNHIPSPPQYYYLLYKQLSIAIYLRKCPCGFMFNQTTKECQCLEFFQLHKGKVGCYFNSGGYGITRNKDVWLLGIFEHTNTYHTQGILIHNHCPYGYCRTDVDSLMFHLETPDDQCAFNRSGILGGACQANLSQVFGTSRCRECSNVMLAVIIPVVALSGIVLVAFLMALNLTVSTGTMNGLIFYANIIRSSQAVFFPPEVNGSFLSIFIAWLNLDLGIETCFYNGLDAYAKAWLQFLFPLYIWFLVLCIIIASRYSSTMSRLFSKNAVQVLATLIFLSYAKIVRAVITVFSFTVLVYPDGSKVKVWLVDGNIEFLKGKHIALFAVSFLMLSVLSIPYTVSLLSIQLLQKISHYHVLLFWVNRLMPLFDAYTGPYKPKHRYWTGLLLVLCIILMAIFSLNYSNDPAVNLLAIAVAVLGLTTYCLQIRIYKNTFANILEVANLFNLGTLTAVSLYQLHGKRKIKLFSNLSTSIAFVLFIIIILYHAAKRLTLLTKGLQKIIMIMQLYTLKFKLL